MIKLTKFPINLYFVTFICINLFFLINFNKGLEFTDESYLLLIGLYPLDAIGRVNNSGIISNLLLNLSNHNIFYFRILGVIILFLASLLLFYSLKENKIKNILNKNLVNDYLLIVILLGSLNYYKNWLITPSYNLYNLIGIIIFLSGLIYFLNLTYQKKLIYLFLGIFLIVFGGLITFISKPITTIFLFFTFILWVFYFFDKKKKILIFLYTSLVSLVVLYAYVYFFYDNLENFINDLIIGIDLRKTLDPNYALLKNFISIPKKILFHLKTNLDLIIIFFSLIFLTKFFVKNNSLELILIIISTILIFFYDNIIFTFFISITYFLHKKNLFELIKNNQDEKNFLFFQFILFVLIFSFTLGTNTNPIYLSQLASILIFLIIFNFIQRFNIKKIFVMEKKSYISLLLIIYTFITIFDNFNNPRRLSNNIFQQKNEINIENFNGTILVDDHTINFINDVKLILDNNEWKKNNYLIDLTGRNPILHLISGARFIKDPWWGGGYLGSDDKAKKIIKMVEKSKIQKSWIVTTNHETKISENVLNAASINLKEEYIIVGFVDRIVDGAKYDYLFWKPKD